ncbi:3327_t:CDS:1, partial [Cetraspora pellucida]
YEDASIIDEEFDWFSYFVTPHEFYPLEVENTSQLDECFITPGVISKNVLLNEEKELIENNETE